MDFINFLFGGSESCNNLKITNDHGKHIRLMPSHKQLKTRRLEKGEGMGEQNPNYLTFRENPNYHKALRLISLVSHGFFF